MTETSSLGENGCFGAWPLLLYTLLKLLPSPNLIFSSLHPQISRTRAGNANGGTDLCSGGICCDSSISPNPIWTLATLRGDKEAGIGRGCGAFGKEETMRGGKCGTSHKSLRVSICTVSKNKMSGLCQLQKQTAKTGCS